MLGVLLRAIYSHIMGHIIISIQLLLKGGGQYPRFRVQGLGFRINALDPNCGWRNLHHLTLGIAKSDLG